MTACVSGRESMACRAFTCYCCHACACEYMVLEAGVSHKRGILAGPEGQPADVRERAQHGSACIHSIATCVLVKPSATRFSLQLI